MRTTRRMSSCTCSTMGRHRRRAKRSPNSPFSPRPVSPFASRRVMGAVAVVAGAAVLASCEIGTITVSKTVPNIVVHSVLNSGLVAQVVLVERTLSGAIPVHDTTFNAADPIVSDGGIPVSGATVEIIDSAGTVRTGVEDLSTSSNGQGAGVYRV